MGKFGGAKLEMMLNSGSSVSLVQQSVLLQAQGIVQARGTTPLRLVTASGDDLPILNHVRARIQVGELKFIHDFVVVGSLVAPVILGVGFLHGNGLFLDFTDTPVKVQHAKSDLSAQSGFQVAAVQIHPMYEAFCKTQLKVCAIAAVEQPGADVVDECVIPMYLKPASIELPKCTNPVF